MKLILYSVIGFSLLGIGIAVFLSVAYAQAQTATTITIDNSDRREYTYCPLDDSEVKSFDAEINGCPLVRVYVNDWSKHSVLEQTTIDTLLRTKGFVDSGEHIIK